MTLWHLKLKKIKEENAKKQSEFSEFIEKLNQSVKEDQNEETP